MLKEPKTAINEHLLDVLSNNFDNTQSFKNWKGSIDEKSAVTLEKCPLVEELKMKTQRSAIFSHFQFQPIHYRSLSTLTHLWTLCQENNVQIFASSCINKIMEQNVQKVLILGLYIARILKATNCSAWYEQQ